jgi:2-polyprenyl-3-methyl-5-hydroxy-6-metoxy-1,4-benzoquinol methylase
MVTVEDLRWWLTLAGDVEWTFARTYAESAPHSYVVLDRTAGMTRDDFVRAAHVIHTFGHPAKFYSMTSIYLTSPDGRLKWWTMDEDLSGTNLINQATTERLYGVQNAPSTVSGIGTPYDEVATRYDEQHPITDAEGRALMELVAPLKSEYPTSVLDVGCGTGRVLDLGLTTPDRFAGVDPSQPMLNMLVRKYPSVGRIYPTTIEQALADGAFTPGQFEIVTVYDTADHLDPATVSALATLASRAAIVRRDGKLELIG